MEKYLKYIFAIVGVIVLFIISYILLFTNVKEYSKNYFYMDTYINVKLSTRFNKSKVDSIFEEIDNIYGYYDKETNVYDEDSLISYINSNDSDEEEIKLDPQIYEMLSLSLKWYRNSNGKFNINMGSVIKVWKKYRDSGTGIPTMEELTADSIDISEIQLLDNYSIKNTNPNIDLGAVSKGYATRKVKDYLDSVGVYSYIINAGGNVVVGKNNKKDYYTIGVEDPTDTSNVYVKIKANNVAVVTSGGYERFYEYNGVRYHHIIDPDTLYPANNMLSVTVISKDSAVADILSTTLFLMNVEDALKLVNNMVETECIIYVDKDHIYKSDGFERYE